MGLYEEGEALDAVDIDTFFDGHLGGDAREPEQDPSLAPLSREEAAGLVARAAAAAVSVVRCVVRVEIDRSGRRSCSLKSFFSLSPTTRLVCFITFLRLNPGSCFFFVV